MVSGNASYLIATLFQLHHSDYDMVMKTVHLDDLAMETVQMDDEELHVIMAETEHLSACESITI